MARTLSGVMEYPDGSPRQGTFTIVALTSASNVSRGASIQVDTGEDGSYTVTLEPNVYRVYFLNSGVDDPIGDDIGVAKVLENGQETTLLDVISNTSGFHPPDDPYHHHCQHYTPETIYISSGGGLEDAPSDGLQYVRQDGQWVKVTGGGGGSSGMRVKFVGVNPDHNGSDEDVDSLPYTLTPDDNGAMIYCLVGQQSEADDPPSIINVPASKDGIEAGFRFQVTRGQAAPVVIHTENSLLSLPENPDQEIVDRIVFAPKQNDGPVSTGIGLRARLSVGSLYLAYRTQIKRGDLIENDDETLVDSRLWVASGDFVDETPEGVTANKKKFWRILFEDSSPHTVYVSELEFRPQKDVSYPFSEKAETALSSSGWGQPGDAFDGNTNTSIYQGSPISGEYLGVIFKEPIPVRQIMFAGGDGNGDIGTVSVQYSDGDMWETLTKLDFSVATNEFKEYTFDVPIISE